MEPTSKSPPASSSWPLMVRIPRCPRAPFVDPRKLIQSRTVPGPHSSSTWTQTLIPAAIHIYVLRSFDCAHACVMLHVRAWRFMRAINGRSEPSPSGGRGGSREHTNRMWCLTLACLLLFDVSIHDIFSICMVSALSHRGRFGSG
jgi:hypothetical protein